MSKSLKLALALCAFAPTSALAEIVYFGGDPILPIYQYVVGAFGVQDEVYEDFDLSTPTHVTGVFLDGYRSASFDPFLARFEIRRNLSSGSSGELIASGQNVGVSIQARPGGAFPGVDFNRYTLSGLNVDLVPGRYWVMIHMNSFVDLSETHGQNGVGSPLNDGNAYLTSPWHSNAFFQPIPSNGNFAYGVVGSAVPEPASLAIFGFGVGSGLLLRANRKRSKILGHRST